MLLTTTHFQGRRASYQAIVRIRIAADPHKGLVAQVRDATDLWTATVALDERLAHRMGDDTEAFFWARIRGGEIDLRDREIDPEWEDDEE